MTTEVKQAVPLTGADVGTAGNVATRLIDSWFPCPEVDKAVGTPMGSGRSEKALFTWFASRPIAQARAAVLCSLLEDTPQNRADIRSAVLTGDAQVMLGLRQRIEDQYGGRPPVVLDMFSGRGIVPLEAARAGASTLGLDISPLATLAGRLLADYPVRDWSLEPELPFGAGAGISEDEERVDAQASPRLFEEATVAESRLLADVRAVLAEIGRRVGESTRAMYVDEDASLPWAYYWAVDMPCDGCGRRFPLTGGNTLRYPNAKSKDGGQWLRITVEGESWRSEVQDGVAVEQPTYTSPVGRRGKSARCPFTDCHHVHSLGVVKAKGIAGQFGDALLAVGEFNAEGGKAFRSPTDSERTRAQAALELAVSGKYDVPQEPIPITAGVDARQYGFPTYGSLMNPRQAALFSTTAHEISRLHKELTAVVSEDYAQALCGYAAGALAKQLRRATRGANLLAHGDASGTRQNTVQVGDVFSSQSILKHQFDYLEATPGAGPGTWGSVAGSLLAALRKVLAGNPAGGRPARLRRASATAIPLRDGTVDVLVTDPPYYDMIAYADSSDVFYVWMKRCLGDVLPDLFSGDCDGPDGLQDKAEEIIVKGRGAKGHGDHRTQDFYETMLERSFAEARRVLKSDGHLTVIFGHSDPEAWKRLLTALTEAGFVVTSSWPSRTETAATGVATISVTVSIGARVAAPHRPVGIAAQVDAEVTTELKDRCRGWDLDGLAHDDQLMASYGAALQVVGRYSKVITPNGDMVPLEHYMTLARRAVRDAIALRLDEQPLETFDPHTRLAVFWHELYGRDNVPKGEARFFAQSDELRLEDLRGPILEETRAGFRLRHDAPERLTPASSAYEVVRGMAAAQSSGTDAVAACMAAAERPATDAHVWALVDWLATKLPASDPVAVALTAVKRNIGTVQASVATQAAREQLTDRPTLFEENS